MCRLLLLGILLGSLCAPVQAQTVWSRPYEPNQITIEALAPELPGEDPAFPSGATFLTATRSLNDNLELSVELPLARYAAGGASATAVGNPYVGLGLSSTRRPLLLEVGLRIPVVPSNQALRAGQRADLGRTAAFRDEAVSVSGLLNTRLSLGRHTTLRLRAGLTYGSVSADSSAGRSGAWNLPYGAQLWRTGDALIAGLSVVGRPAITDAADGRGSAHHAVVSLMLNGARLQPGVLLGTGLDPLVQGGNVAWVGGLTLSVSYGQ